jgi:hypothetical protein
MTLRLTLSAVAGGFFRAVTEGERPIAKAATAAVREAAELAKTAGRANIAAAGFGRKWQNALRAKIYPTDACQNCTVKQSCTTSKQRLIS